MSTHPRYEIIKPIAHGDFATVFHGFDRELEREVAIKQIHPQFLDEPKKLERYWKEAQLLASLEHPYIMTIYDIVRDRGWLILELMQGSLQQKLAGRPIDLEDLRLTIIYMCHALGFLHKNGIIHGDVKPSNLLLDKNHRVKLGDFGIARRLVSDDGSVIKGTTKYMAPEVVSDQFGPVGHHSDLYSLGFAAYELMCGDQFEEKLFPGLHMPGRDPQISWMMWHGARDRKIPEISKVLEGVPPDLARVVGKLCQKEPTERYLNASEVIFDLKTHAEGKDPDELKRQEAEKAEQEEAKKKKRRALAYVAIALSMLLSLALLFVNPNSKPTETVADYPRAGVIDEIEPGRKIIGVKVDGQQRLAGLELGIGDNEIFLNDRRVSFADLAVGDQLAVKRVTSDEGTYFIVNATRETRTRFNAMITSVDANNGVISVKGTTRELSIEESGGEPDNSAAEGQVELVPTLSEASSNREFSLYVPTDLAISYNGRREWDGTAFRMRDFKEGDHVAGTFVAHDGANQVLSLRASRKAEMEGSLQSVDRDRGILTVLAQVGNSEKTRTLRLDPNCKITLNGVESLSNGHQVSLSDLRSGDSLMLTHDDMIRAIDAQREIRSTGIVASVNPIDKTVSVEVDSPSRLVRFQLDDDSQIGLLSTGEERTLAFLRKGDRVEIEHDSPDFVEPNVRTLAIDPIPNVDSFAVLISFSQFDDPAISPIALAEADRKLIRESLEEQYRIPDGQILEIKNPTRLSLINEIEDFIGDIPANGQLLVYLNSRAFAVPDKKPVFALKETQLNERDLSGMTLDSFLELVESATTRETILMLDVAHPGSGEDISNQLDSETFAQTSKETESHPLSPNVAVLASCRAGEVNHAADGRMGSVFATTVSEAFSGTADENRDWIVNSDELAEFALQSFEDLTFNRRVTQNPTYIQPDPTPIRVLPATKEAVRKILAHLEDGRYESATQDDFQTASELQPGQPDAWMAFAVVSLNHHRTAEARDLFQQVAIAHPREPLPHLILAWQDLVAKDYESGMRNLTSVLGAIDTAEGESEVAMLQPLVEMTGKMKAFAEATPEEPLAETVFEKFNERAEKLDPELLSTLNRSTSTTQAELAKLWTEIEDSQSTTASARLVRQYRRLATFCDLDYQVLRDYCEERLDR